MSARNVAAIVLAALVAGALFGSLGVANAEDSVKAGAACGTAACSSCEGASTCTQAAACDPASGDCAECANAATCEMSTAGACGSSAAACGASSGACGSGACASAAQ